MLNKPDVMKTEGEMKKVCLHWEKAKYLDFSDRKRERSDQKANKVPFFTSKKLSEYNTLRNLTVQCSGMSTF